MTACRGSLSVQKSILIRENSDILATQAREMTISNQEDKPLKLQEILSVLSHQYIDGKNKDFALRITTQTSSKRQLFNRITQTVIIKELV